MKFSTVVLLTLLIANSNLRPAIIHVPADKQHIQDAVNIAVAGDTILVAEGTYYENINFRGKSVTIASHYVLDGDTSHISGTIIDGSKPTNPDSGSVVFFDSGEDSTSALIGFTITGGSGTINSYIDSDFGLIPNRSGGGIFVDSSGAKIQSNIIKNNHIVSQLHGFGGGIRAWAAPANKTIVVDHNHILNNTIKVPENSGGGGIDIYNLSVTDSRFIVTNNIIEQNTVTISSNWKAWGGGIACHTDLPFDGETIIDGNIIRDNRLFCVNSFGAGIYITFWEYGIIKDHNAMPRIFNNIIYDNYSQTNGAAISIWNLFIHQFEGSDINPRPFICNNTIVDNIGKSAIHIYQSHPLLMNNIIHNKQYTDGEFFFEGLKAYNDTTLLNNLVGTDPLNFVPDTYEPTEISPVVGNGSESFQIGDRAFVCPPNDFYGNSRPHPVDGQVDIGAVESEFRRIERIPGDSSRIIQTAGYGTPEISCFIYEPEKVRSDIYRITIDDKTFGYKTFRVVNSTTGDTVIRSGNQLDGTRESDLFDGIRLLIKDFQQPVIDDLHTGWINSNSNLAVSAKLPTLSIGGSTKTGKPYSADYRITISDQIIDSTTAAFEISPTPVYFKVQNITENIDADFIFQDQNKDQKLGDNEVIYLLQENETAGYDLTWAVYFTATGDPILPIPGDQVMVQTFKPLTSEDVFEFQVVVAIIRDRDVLPSGHRLFQNYANPFNQTTVIKWQLALRSMVELTLYNILGEKVATLVSRQMDPGIHSFRFDGKDLASGIYYYQLVAGDPSTRSGQGPSTGLSRAESRGSGQRYREVKKMILLK